MLRRRLGAERIETRPSGYALRLAFRSAPMAEFRFEAFASHEATRLEELRVTALG